MQPLMQNIRIVNEQVTQRVKSSFKTNLRLIEKSRGRLPGAETFRLNQTYEDFYVSSTVANQFIKLIKKSQRQRKFDEDYPPLTRIKPIQRRNPLQNEALVMNQTTHANFEPLDERKSTSLKIKIKDISLDDERRRYGGGADLSQFGLANMYSPHAPETQLGVEEEEAGEREDLMSTEKPSQRTRNVYSKMASPGLGHKEDSDSET